MLTLILYACTPKEDDAETSWEPPVFEGDGLPASADTAHGRDDPDTGGTGMDTGDTGDDAVPEIIVVDGLFAYYDYGFYGIFGILALLTESATCGDVFGGASSLDAVYYYLYGDAGNLSDGWGGLWMPCGDVPCAQSFWLLGGDFGYLDGGVDITSYDAHYLTVDWSSEASTGTGLTLYNCGDGFNWD